MHDHDDCLPVASQPGRRTAPDEVWVQVREDYLGGLSAPECCRRYGVGLSALRERAAREGWRRIDQPWTPPNRLDPDDEGVVLEEQVGGDLNKVELAQLSYVAFRRMMRAVMRGDAAEALRWRRVRQAMDEEEAELDRMVAQQEAVRHYLGYPDDPDASDGVSGEPAASGPEPGVSPPSSRPDGRQPSAFISSGTAVL